MKTVYETKELVRAPAASRQFATFLLANRLYGIDVTQVQEIAKPLPLTPVRLAPPYVAGLINLRGQIATAIDLRELFGLESDSVSARMSVVCRCDGFLLSFLVDQIGDVMEMPESNFEPSPDIIDAQVRRFMRGVYKHTETILSVLDLNKLNQLLAK